MLQIWSYVSPLGPYWAEMQAIEEGEWDNPEWERLLARVRLGGRLLDSAVAWFGGRDLTEDLSIRFFAANLQLDPQLPLGERLVWSAGMSLVSHATALVSTRLFSALINTLL